METLNEIVEKYLDINGIKINFFAEYIDCEPSKCCRWLKGERKLNSNQIKKAHDFLQGKFLKTIDEVMKGE